MVLVIGIGLLWRSGLLALPNFIAKYGGDSLWALVVFLCFGFVSPRSSTVRIGFIAVCFAWSVEFLQLYHAHWIDGIRLTRLGRVVLGTTFNSPDLLAYVVGIALGALAERVYLNEKPKNQLKGLTVQAMAGTPADLWMRQVPPCLTLIVSAMRVCPTRSN